MELPEEFNLTNALIDAHVAKGRGDRIAIYYQDQRLTYRDVQRLVNKAGNALASIGTEMENRVAILMHDSPDWIACFFGAIKIGAVPIPLNTMMTPSDYEYILNDSRAKTIIVNDSFLKPIEEVADNLRHLRNIVVVGENAGKHLSYKELVDVASPELEAASTHRDEPGYWWYTSGSTGTPKGTVHLQHDLMYLGKYFGEDHLGLREEDIVFTIAKLFFSFGTGVLGAGLYTGAPVVLMTERPLPDKVLEAITKYKPTVFLGVPSFFANLLEVDNIDRNALSSIRSCHSGGEQLPAQLYERFKQRFGIELLDVMGSTEIAGAFLGSKAGKVKPGSVGQVLPGHEAKLLDEEGREVPTGEIGELYIKGEASSPCYWNKHQKTKETMVGEWIRTGDIFRKDEEGYFWSQGRVDDVIKAGGIKVSPTEVEATLLQHPAVAEAAIVGAPDKDGLTKPKAFVVLRSGYQSSPDLARELQQHIKDRLAPYNYPRWVEFATELPRTTSGKIQRFKLR